MTTRTLPTYFISHGGGPWPWMKDLTNGAYDRLEASLTEMPQQIGMTPKAVLVISGHWEERDFTVIFSANPPMIYYYSGFREHTYRIKYAARGSPESAERVSAFTARRSSHSCDACQKNRYGLMVVPKIATTVVR